MDVSSEPSLTMLDQYFEIIKSIDSWDIVVRDDQNRQLKLSSSQKMVLCEFEFLSHNKFLIRLKNSTSILLKLSLRYMEQIIS